ncbi:retrovirus-related pol polyprotein from transposon TNT 1-94 [Tanacetum coccineum]
MLVPTGSTLPTLQTAEDLQGDELLHYDAEIELMNLILLSIPNEIYNSVDACTTAKEMWKRVERLMRGTIQNQVDRETRFTNEFDQFVAEPGEALVSVYNRFAQLMNDLERNKMIFPIVTGSSSRNTSSYYVTHPTSVVDYDDEYQQDDVQTNSKDPLASAMLLLARAITQNFSTVCGVGGVFWVGVCVWCVIVGVNNPTNNRFILSSTPKNQAIIQGDRVNIQSRNPGNTGRNTRRAYVQEEVVEGSNAQNEIGNAKQDEAGELLTDEQNDFLFADASRMEEIEELSANICLMAKIQPASNTSDAGPSYDFAFISEVQSSSINENKEQMYPIHTKIINSTIGDDQIDSNIIFDEPNGNVNSGSVEKDTHVPDLYALEQLARNAYKEAEKQQLFAQKVQQQNTTLTSQLELYKEKGFGLENIQKLYLASSLSNSEIPLNVRDTEDTLDDASKSQQKRKGKMNDPITLNANSSIPASIPSESPLIIQLDKMKSCFQTLSELIQKNCKRASIFYTSPEEIQLNDFCQDQFKPIVNKLQFYFEFFRKLFQRDIKEMKDAFESTKSELCEIKKQNDFLKDQLLEASLRHENSIEIQEGLQAKIKILEKDVQRCQKQSVDFELKLQHEKEKHKWESTLNNKNTNPLDYSWISKMEKLENENVSLEFQVQSLIKERDNVKLEYQKLFDSIKKTRSQSQKEMDELIDHVSEKTYAYGAIRAENQNLLSTISELQTRLETVEKGKSVNTKFDKTRKSKKASHPPKLVPSDHSKLELLHMDLCGPMMVASINGKKYILVIVDDYSRYTWVYFLHLKDETLEIIKKFITQAQLNYKAKVCKIRTDNGTEFKNATLKAHYEKLGIMQQFSTACTSQQNGVVERHNCTLVEAARTIIILYLIS